MSSPNKAFCDWAASKLLEQIRRNDLTPSLNYNDFIWFPLPDSLWEQVVPSDKTIIITMVNDPNMFHWGLLLSRGLPKDTDITELLLNIFNSTNDPERKLFIFHEIAYRDTNDGIKNVLLDYLVSNMPLFLELEKKYFGSEDVIIERCNERVNNSKFANKRWVYLFTAHASNNAKDKNDFINKFVNDKDEFISKAATRSLTLVQ